jgi:hypothetical protein
MRSRASDAKRSLRQPESASLSKKKRQDRSVLPFYFPFVVDFALLNFADEEGK